MGIKSFVKYTAEELSKDVAEALIYLIFLWKTL